VKGAKAPTPSVADLGAALRAAANQPGGITFVDLQERELYFPWPEIYARAAHVAAALANLGVCPGERVGLVLPTEPAFLDAFFGALLAGAVPVPLAPPQRLGRLDEHQRATARMLKAADACIVLSNARLLRLIGVAMAEARPRLGCRSVETLVTHPERLDRDLVPEALAIIQFSSGSTVDPKPVALTQANVMAQLAALAELLPGPQRAVSWLPLHHDMGLIGALLSSVYRPLPLVLIPPELFLGRPALWLRAIARHRATVSPAPSFAYSLCIKRIRDAELDGLTLDSWRFALNGAEPVSVGVLAEFATRFARFGFDAGALTPVYGMAEATLAVTFSPAGVPPRSLGVDAVRLARDGVVSDGARRIASVGTPVPGVALSLRDDDGVELPERRVGRIWVRGPAVMRGYFNDATATARALVDGWLDTGDLGFIAGGELFICGRAKDVIIIRGANHAPQEFEECLEGLAGVRQGCAVALGFIPDGGGEEALLVLAEHAGERAIPSLEEVIRGAILTRTGVLAHTVRVLAPGTLPRTTSGKLRRAEALRRFIAKELTKPARVSWLGLLRAMVRSTLALARLRMGRALRAPMEGHG
jgi:acyl-CoA synthetase (AMP-forming)/AMP-acid ligase II